MANECIEELNLKPEEIYLGQGKSQIMQNLLNCFRFKLFPYSKTKIQYLLTSTATG